MGMDKKPAGMLAVGVALPNLIALVFYILYEYVGDYLIFLVLQLLCSIAAIVWYDKREDKYLKAMPLGCLLGGAVLCIMELLSPAKPNLIWGIDGPVLYLGNYIFPMFFITLLISLINVEDTRPPGWVGVKEMDRATLKIFIVGVALPVVT